MVHHLQETTLNSFTVQFTFSFVLINSLVYLLLYMSV